MTRTLALLLLLSIASSVAAQQQPPEDPIGQQLYPPELIMGHQQALGLQEKQRALIKSEVQKAQSKFFDHQWQMNEESEKLVALLRSTPIDESAVLAQADKVMELERQIKKIHLGLLVRLKNMLTVEQIAKLDQLRKRS